MKVPPALKKLFEMYCDFFMFVLALRSFSEAVDFLGLYWNQIVAELREWSKVMALAGSLDFYFM